MAATTTKASTPKSKAATATTTNTTTTTAGVKKAGRPPTKGRKGKASAAMAKMQAYFKKNRSKYESLDFKDQQKKLGEDWKKSPENPKNQA